MYLLIVVMIFLLPLQAEMQIVSPGKCPPQNVKTEFDLSKYLGRWYQYASFGTELFQGRGKCVMAEYTLEPSDRVKVFNYQINTQTGQADSIDGSAILAEPDKREGKLIVKFTFEVFGQKISVSSPYWVLDTDYTSWALVYSCTDATAFHASSGWILTRDQDLSSAPNRNDAMEEINNALAKAKLNSYPFKKTVQNECP